MAARPVALDRIDHRILEELQRDAGLTNQELAERVGLSPSPCLRRVKALEDTGIIEKRVALLSREKLGLSLTALIQIAMDRHTPERFDKSFKALPTLELGRRLCVVGQWRRDCQPEADEESQGFGRQADVALQPLHLTR